MKILKKKLQTSPASQLILHARHSSRQLIARVTRHLMQRVLVGSAEAQPEVEVELEVELEVVLEVRAAVVEVGVSELEVRELRVRVEVAAEHTLLFMATTPLATGTVRMSVPSSPNLLHRGNLVVTSLMDSSQPENWNFSNSSSPLK
eukprot:scpid38891/ scgid18744/ 